jgi:UDP-N-acetylmuramoyl-tripeptide--D-alanyl-D-alanine ligase
MIRFSLGALAGPLGGRQVGGDAAFSSVSTDSRHLAPGDLFVALVGPRHDAHAYLGQAVVHGAVAALVDRDVDVAMPRLVVPDTRLALGRLAALWRNAGKARVLAVTGSNGKTTVKEMLASVLRQRGTVLATEGNLNNDIGVPLTLTRLQDEDYAVVEMGANHAGEIRYLSELATPDVALLNNAGRAHLEGFGSLEGVARAKAEIMLGLRPGGTFVYHADSPWAALWRELAGGRRLLGFGVRGDADVCSPGERTESWSADGFVSRFAVRLGDELFEVGLHLGGEHNRLNALAAAAAAWCVGAGPAQVRAGLECLRPVAGRLCPRRRADGLWVVDDTYNANPDSVAAAARVLAAAPGRRILVLGDLAELGEESGRLHAEVGGLARSAGVDLLWTAGTASAAASTAFGGGGKHFASHAQLADALRETAGPGDYVLIKGSRSARMERIVDALFVEEPLSC